MGQAAVAWSGLIDILAYSRTARHGYASRKSDLVSLVPCAPLKKIIWSILLALALLLVIGINAPAHALPSIGTPSIQPTSPSPNDAVRVSVSVIDYGSGVASVSIVYTTNNWVSVNNTIQAPYNATNDDYEAMVPAQPSGTHVLYYVVAVDASNNRVMNNNSGSYCAYDVGGTGGGGGGGNPLGLTINSWLFWAIVLGLGATLVGVLVMGRRRSSSSQKTGKKRP